MKIPPRDSKAGKGNCPHREDFEGHEGFDMNNFKLRALRDRILLPFWLRLAALTLRWNSEHRATRAAHDALGCTPT